MEEGKFILDIQKINDFVMDNGSQRSNETEILEHSEADSNGSLALKSRDLKETKLSNDANSATVRYDIFKMLFDFLDTIGFDAMDEESGMEGISLDFSTLAQSVAFNTLLSYGFLKKVDD